jgi:hypothetical protein
MASMDGNFQKPVYVIINGYRENSFRIPPSNQYLDASHLIAGSPKYFGSLVGNTIKYIPDLNCIINAGYTLASSSAAYVYSRIWELTGGASLPTNQFFNRASATGFPSYSIPFMTEVANYFQFRKNIDFGNVSTNTGQRKVVLPFYVSEKTYKYQNDNFVPYTYAVDGINQSIAELSDPNLIKISKKDYVDKRPTELSIDYWVSLDANHFRFNAQRSFLVRCGRYKKSRDEGITFLMVPFTYYAPYRDKSTTKEAIDIIGIIHTNCFLYLIYGQAGRVKLVQVYQRHSGRQEKVIGNVRCVEYQNLTDFDGKAFQYCGSFLSPHSEGSVGFTIRYIMDGYLHIEFHNKILNNSVDESLSEKLANNTRYLGGSATEEEYIAAAWRGKNKTQMPVYINALTTNGIRTAFRYCDTSNNIVVDPSEDVRVYLCGLYSVFYSITCPCYQRVSEVETGDVMTGIIHSPQNVSITPLVGNFNYHFHRNEVVVLANIRQRNRNDFTPIEENSPQQVERDNINYQTPTASQPSLPSSLDYPAYSFVFSAIRNVDYSGVIDEAVRVYTIPVPIYGAYIAQPGVLVEGYLRVPSKVVIPMSRIVNISINRGSVFEEHGQITIWNEDGQYDFLKNMVEYNVLIAVDMTRENNWEPNPDFDFNSWNNIPAEELGIPAKSMVIFRGVSDMETPITVKVVRTEDDFKKQELITLNIHGPIHKVKQMVPIVAESFNAYTHIFAIRDILYRAGFNVFTDFITDYTNELSDVVLQPPIPTIHSGYVIEPPNNFGDFIRKIVNEFSGWWFYYSHIRGKFYYLPKDFRIRDTDLIHWSFASYKSWKENNGRIHKDSVITDADLSIIRPIGTMVVLYGGTTIPGQYATHISVNRRAVEDPNYEFFIGRNIPVVTYSPVHQSKVLENILRNLSYRILLGRKVLNLSVLGLVPGMFRKVWVEKFGKGIVKNSTLSYSGNDKILKGTMEIELVNYRDTQNNEYAVFWDNL